jgi:DNA-binding transcriptional LysR family regulator
MGELAVTAPVVFGRLHLVPVVAQFLAQYPEIGIKLLLTDRVVHLMEEQIDVALRIGQLPDSSLDGEPASAWCAWVVCGSPSLPGASTACLRGAAATWRATTASASTCMESRRAWVFGSGKSALSVPVVSRLEVNTAEAAIGAATLGVGLVRVLSYQVADALAKGALKLVLEDYESAPFPISLVHKGQTPLPLKLRAFLDFVAPRLRERVAQVLTAPQT